ncbi:MAG: MarR family transcriptional regulator [Rhizobiaceae bacterium]|nr:MarR family transcriptional regulator [Rhizobiaceae bacterium]
MSGAAIKPVLVDSSEEEYRLDEQIGFLLRKANQRHLAIFARRIPDLTPPQFAVLAKLWEVGETSQNQLGQLVAMDAATVKGVIDRLRGRALVELAEHDSDRRRIVVSLSADGRTLVEAMLLEAAEITAETLAPLTQREAATLVRLLAKLS